MTKLQPLVSSHTELDSGGQCCLSLLSCWIPGYFWVSLPKDGSHQYTWAATSGCGILLELKCLSQPSCILCSSTCPLGNHVWVPAHMSPATINRHWACHNVAPWGGALQDHEMRNDAPKLCYLKKVCLSFFGRVHGVTQRLNEASI